VDSDNVASDDVLIRVQDALVKSGAQIPPWRASDDERARFVAQVARTLVELRAPLAQDALPSEARRLAGMMLGVGVLTPLLEQDGLEEIIVRRGHVQVERRGRIEDVGDWPDSHFEAVANRAADLGGRAMTGSRPYVLVDLPDGSRFTAIKPPLSVAGVSINIRVFPKRKLTLDDLLAKEALPEAVARFLRAVVRANLATILISGEFGAGKTTLLNALSAYVPAEVPMAVVETFQELQPGHPHPARAVTSVERSEGQVAMRDVVNVLYTRMRPDLIVIGEIVAGEAAEFLKAVNLGKRAMSTIHGDSPLDALYRLEVLALEVGLPVAVSRELISRGIDLLVHVRRDGARRLVSEVAQVEGLDEANRYRIKPLYWARLRSRADAIAAAWREAGDE